jgi:hypothetical protein
MSRIPVAPSRADTHRLRPSAIPGAFQDHDLDYSQHNPPFEYVSLSQLELKPNPNSVVHRPDIFNITYSPPDEALFRPPSTTLCSSLSVDGFPGLSGTSSTSHTSLAASPISPLPKLSAKWLPNQPDSTVSIHSPESLDQRDDRPDINMTAIGRQYSASQSVSDRSPSSIVDQVVISQPQRSVVCEICTLHMHLALHPCSSAQLSLTSSGTRLVLMITSNKHRKRHLRSFKCEFPACDSNEFALKKYLTRPMTSRHREAISNAVT